MASRKTAATDTPAKSSATRATTAAAKKGATARTAASSSAKKTASETKGAAASKTAAKKGTAAAARKASATTKKSTATAAKKAPARAAAKAASEAAATPRKATRPSARASKRVLTAMAEGRTEPTPERSAASLEMARLAAKAALDKKGEDVVILDVRGLTTYADYFVIASGTSDRHVTALADNVEEQLKKAGHRTIGVEGYTRGHWVLLDFGDVVAHVFYDEARAFYDLEGLWSDAIRVPVE